MHNFFTVEELELRGVLRVEDGNHGEYRPRPQEFTPEGVAFIRAADLGNGNVHFARAARINDTAVSRIRKGVGRDYDVLLSHKGTVGRAALVPVDSPPFVCSPQTTFWRSLDHDQLDPGYLYAVVRSPAFASQLEIHKSNTDMAPYVSLTQQRTMSIPVPPISEQRAIAEVLGALDDKIAVNTRLGQAAIDLAGAYFAATQRASSSTSTLGEIVALEYGKALPASRRHPGNVTVYGSGGPVGSHDAALAKGPGVVVGRKGTAGAVHWAPEPFYPIDTTFFVVPRADWVSAQYSYFLLLYCALDKMNSDSAVPGLSRGEALQRRIQVPPVAAVERFTERAAPLMACRDQAAKENLTLAATRDALLPALMSGKLCARDAESIVGDLT